MPIIIENKDTLIFDDFKFRCCVGKGGFSKDKREGDKKTPIGRFKLDYLYFRKDRKRKPKTILKTVAIKKNMGWCDDIKSKSFYNRRINIKKNLKYEKLYRKDHKYDYLIPIKYNWNKIKIGKGSAIFIHITKNYKPTAGCIALSAKDFLILISLIKKKTTIKII